MSAAIVLEIPSRTEFLSLVRALAKRAALRAGFPEAEAERVGLAVDECATNVIEHAYHEARDRRLEVRLDDTGMELVVEVVDTGDAVDPLAVPKVDLEKYASERRKGGLGVHLMGKIMDSVTFLRVGGANVCRLVKSKHAAEQDGAA